MYSTNNKKIVIASMKGGCGKTVLSTNLACTYAHQGKNVVLVDYDSQAASSMWQKQREKKLPKIDLIEAWRPPSSATTRSFQMRFPANSDRIILDTPTNPSSQLLDEILPKTEAILIPIVPTLLDIRASTRFIGNLLLHRQYKRTPAPIGVVLCRKNSLNSEYNNKLDQLLKRFNITQVAEIEESQHYVRFSEIGEGALDYKEDKEISHLSEAWEAISKWVDECGLNANKEVKDQSNILPFRKPFQLHAVR